MAVALAVIAVLTLSPSGDRIAPHSRLCLVCGDYGTLDVLQNVAMFGPFGLALARALGPGAWRPLVALLAGLACSAAVEVAQLTVIPGRDATLSDVIANGGGAALGAWLWVRRALLLAPGPTAAGRLAVAAVAAFVVVTGGSAWLLRPSVRPDRWYGQIRPRLGTTDLFTAPVRDARLGDSALVPWKLPFDTVARARLARDTISLAVTAGTEGALRRLSPIVRVVDSTRHEVTALFQRADAVGYTVRPRSQDVLLRGVQLRIPGVFGREGEVRLSGGRAGHHVWLVAEAAGARRERHVALAPSMGWSLVLPWDEALDGAWWKDALWLAALALPWGYWAARARRRGPQLAAGGVVLLASLAGGAMLARLALPPLGAWLGLLAGAVIGSWMGPRGRGGDPPEISLRTAAKSDVTEAMGHALLHASPTSPVGAPQQAGGVTLPANVVTQRLT